MMGLQAIYPARVRPSHPAHKKYPYLLRGLTITRPNQVWSADITYVPMPTGFMYLVAVMDWFSRFVLAWQLSNTLDGLFCLEALRLALAQGQPDIFNTDQGVQFTAIDFTGELDNGPHPHQHGWSWPYLRQYLHRTPVAHRQVRRHLYQGVSDRPASGTGLGDYFHLYNYERPHQSLAYRTPADVHFAVKVPNL